MNKRAAIVCKHVLDNPACAKHALRTASTDPSDSGWQVLCDRESHTAEDARIVSVHELMQLIPMMESIIENPAPFTGELRPGAKDRAIFTPTGLSGLYSAGRSTGA